MARSLDSIDVLISEAIAAAGVKNDSALSRRLGLSKNAVSSWRRKVAFPSPETAIVLAELTGREPSEVILQCEAWRAAAASKPAVYKAYMDMLQQVAKTAAVVLLFATLTKLTMGTNIAQAALLPTDNRILCDRRPWWLRLLTA